MKLFQPKSKRDLENLSAYLDGAISRREAAQLLRRLEVETRLCQQLTELRNVRTLLHDLPQAPLPRNFALGPEQDIVRSRKGAWQNLAVHPWVFNRGTLVPILCIIVLTSSYLIATRTGDLMSSTTMSVQEYQADCNNDDDPIIYWTEAANYVRHMPVACEIGEIRFNKSPAEIKSVVEGIGAGEDLRQIAADDKHVYWADMKNHRIMKALRDENEHQCPSDDACFAIIDAEHEIEIDQPHGLAVDANSIYWSDRSTGAIWRTAKNGADPPTILLSEGTGAPTWLALDGKSLYFTDWMNKRIMRVQIDGSSASAEQIVPAEGMTDLGPFDPFGIAVHENEIYWANKAGGKIQKMALVANGTITTLVSDTKLVKNPLGIAIDKEGRMIYWASSGSGQEAIRGVSIDGGLIVERAKWLPNAGYPAGLWVGRKVKVEIPAHAPDSERTLY